MTSTELGKAIKSYIPRQELEWKPDQPDGSGSARIECEEGVVDFFTYVGDERHAAFTQMEIWIHPRRYYTTIQRHYHPLWWRRLARQFAWEAGKIAEGGPQ